jgi:RHS repeat-associated protein
MVATWDFKDRLASVEDATMRADYVYDAADRRITKSVTKKGPMGPKPGDSSGGGVSHSFTTIYVGKHFEVREFDAPTKFVFNNDVRVAKVVGSLSSNERIQRLRVYPGWNLVSVAVDGVQVGAQLLATGLAEAIYRWNPIAREFAALPPNESLSAGTVLWVKSSGAGTLRVVGIYPGPMQRLRVPCTGAFLPSQGLEVFPLSSPRTGLLVWRFAPELQAWQTGLRLPSFTFSDLPLALAPHEAFYGTAPEDMDLDQPNPATSVRFYHGDQLGSSSAVTDGDGKCMLEIAYYGFGSERYERRTNEYFEPYLFANKEKDIENALLYFNARFMSPSLGRFLTPDPVCVNVNGSGFAHPQKLNAYAYCLNSPTRFIDPSGLSEIDVHQFLTEYLAAEAGFSADDARALGLAAQAADAPGSDKDALYEMSKSGHGNVTNMKLFHFPSQKQLGVLRAGALASPFNNEYVGDYIHALEDSYAHDVDPMDRSGVYNELGSYGHLLAGHKQDWAHLAPEKTVRMAEKVFYELQALHAARGGGGQCKAFSGIENTVRSFAAFRPEVAGDPKYGFISSVTFAGYQEKVRILNGRFSLSSEYNNTQYGAKTIVQPSGAMPSSVNAFVGIIPCY